MTDPEAPHPLDERKGGVRSPTIRKLAKDGTAWTPTEQVTRNRLMKQFCKLEGAAGNSEAYKQGYDLIDWTNGGTR